MKKNLIFISTHEPKNIEFFDMLLQPESTSYLPRRAMILLFPSVSQFDDFVRTAAADFEFSLLVHLGKLTFNSTNEGDMFAEELRKLPYAGNLEFEFTSRAGEAQHAGKEVRQLTKLMTKDFPLENLPVNKVSSLISKSNAHNAFPDPEFAILTALFEDEHKSFDSNMSSSVVAKEKNMRYGRFTEAKDFPEDYQHSFITAYQQDMGSVDAAAFTTNIITKYSPKYVIMGGVCGGLKDDVKLYDVIIPWNIQDYMSGKFKKGVFTPRPLRAEPNQELVSFLETIKSDIIDNMRRLAQPNMLKIINAGFNIHFMNYACGPWVVKTEGKLQLIKETFDEDIVGLEMESLGVIRAAKIFQKNNQYSLVVKSVMDFTDENKTDGDKGAIKTTAALMSYLCVRAIMPLLKDFVDVKA